MLDQGLCNPHECVFEVVRWVAIGKMCPICIRKYMLVSLQLTFNLKSTDSSESLDGNPMNTNLGVCPIEHNGTYV